jgi:predicted lipid-binding transport protein (Tim44 family)
MIVLLLGAAVPLPGQSLAEVARQEEERRKAIRTPGKVYTNESLRPEPPSSTPPPAQPSQPAQPAPPASPGASDTPAAAGAQPPQGQAQPAAGPSPAPAPPTTEAEWRKRIAAAREALSRSQIFAEALQTRINALTTDFVNRDDPAQRALIEQDRLKALAELDRVKQEIQQHQKAIAGIQEDARRAGVPAGWVR